MKNRVKHFLKEHAGMNIPLAFDEAYDLGCYALEGCRGDQRKSKTKLAQIQSITVLSALHNKATYGWKSDGIALEHNGHKLPFNSAEQIAGVCAAIFEQDIGKSEFKYLKPNVPYAMDNCGMGGDLITTANVSTIAALIASAAGIPMCKHGSPANADAGRHGSSDFVSLLGINTKATRIQVQKCVEDESFGYTEALDTRYKLIHMQTHKVAMLPHMNDIIGPITNPLSPHIMTRRVLGVNHLINPRIIAEAYQILNKRGCTDMQYCLIVRGFAKTGRCEGMDEVSICESGTQVAELKDGVIKEYHLTASDFGLTPVSQASISPPNGMSKGEFSLAILKGEIGGPPLQMVLANTALLFYLAERSADLKECYNLAKTVYESGGAYRKALAVSKGLPV
jgi:anthranilate phosphoribosyltransferase